MTEQPAKPRSKRMVGFYVGMGVVAALFVGGWFAWTPLKLRYAMHRLDELERSRTITHPGWYLDCCLDEGRAGNGVAMDAAIDYLETMSRREVTVGMLNPLAELVKLGPPARDAVARLLTADNPYVRIKVLDHLREQRASWALPLTVKMVEEDDKRIACGAIRFMEQIAGRRFLDPIIRDHQRTEDRRRALDWWKKEGKAKYGSAR